MTIIRSPAKTFWHVVHNNVMIGCFYTKKEAQSFINDMGELPAMLREQAF